MRRRGRGGEVKKGGAGRLFLRVGVHGALTTIKGFKAMRMIR